MTARKGIWRARLAGLISALIALVLVFQDFALVHIARDRLFDQFQRLSPRAEETLPVRIVEIDDAALAQYGQWPWPRHRLADMVDNLTNAGAAAVVFDIILAEPDRTSPANVATSWLDAPDLAPILADLADADLQAVDHDLRLAEALARAPSVLHLTAQAAASDTATACPPALEGARVGGMAAGDLARVAPSFREVIPALPLFRETASGEGFARVGLAQDAIVRSVPLIALACDGTQIYPSLALEALRVAAPRLDPSLAPAKFIHAAQRDPCRAHITGIANDSVSEVVLCRLRIPTTTDGKLWVHFSPPDTAEKRKLTVEQVLEGAPAALANDVNGRIVMIGASAEGLRDVMVTPIGDDRPGVHIHAEVIEQILAEETLFRAWDLMRPVEIIAAALVSLLLIIFLPRMPAAAAFGVWGALTVVIFVGAFFAFSSGRMLIDPVTPGVIVASAFFGAFVVLFQHEQLAREFIRNAFGKFLSPLILDRLERDPELLKLEGESREITAFFSDIRGFTTISEQLEPQQVTALLNQYFTPMTRIVVDHKGLVDKYMGDGLAAMWNAPIDVDDHPAQACRAALQMVATLATLNEKWASDKELPVPEINIGIGLHTAHAQVGNFGSEDHLEYSMLGDMVNLTSRLEALTKRYCVQIIISEQTRAQAPDFASVALGSFTVKGRSEPTAIFALMGDESLAKDPAFRAFKEAFEAGVAALDAGERDTALAKFKECRKGPDFGLGGALDYFSGSIAD